MFHSVMADQKEFLASFKGRIPKGIVDEQHELAQRIQKASG
jgi:hypothetical protein